VEDARTGVPRRLQGRQPRPGEVRAQVTQLQTPRHKDTKPRQNQHRPLLSWCLCGGFDHDD
jgi:hypothetical protein